jgi:hypothetical protein
VNSPPGHGFGELEYQIGEEQYRKAEKLSVVGMARVPPTSKPRRIPRMLKVNVDKYGQEALCAQPAAHATFCDLIDLACAGRTSPIRIGGQPRAHLCETVPASNAIRFTAKPGVSKKTTSCGALKIFASFIILPCVHNANAQPFRWLVDPCIVFHGCPPSPDARGRRKSGDSHLQRSLAAAIARGCPDNVNLIAPIRSLSVSVASRSPAAPSAIWIMKAAR